MQVQFIYTFENIDQKVTDWIDLYRDFTENKNVFLSFAMSTLKTDEEKETLVKISCCIISSREPEWYTDANGKFWLDDIERWREDNGVKSEVSEDFGISWSMINDD